jgi:hypothetical protein
MAATPVVIFKTSVPSSRFVFSDGHEGFFGVDGLYATSNAKEITELRDMVRLGYYEEVKTVEQAA